MNCLHCGAQPFTRRARFCTRCGGRLERRPRRWPAAVKLLLLYTLKLFLLLLTVVAWVLAALALSF